MAKDSEHERRFIDRMRKLREHRGWSCQRLADATSLSRVALSKIENGSRGLSLGEAVTIARALGVTVEQMSSPEPMVLKTETKFD